MAAEGEPFCQWEKPQDAPRGTCPHAQSQPSSPLIGILPRKKPKEGILGKNTTGLCFSSFSGQNLAFVILSCEQCQQISHFFLIFYRFWQYQSINLQMQCINKRGNLWPWTAILQSVIITLWCAGINSLPMTTWFTWFVFWKHEVQERVLFFGVQGKKRQSLKLTMSALAPRYSAFYLCVVTDSMGSVVIRRALQKPQASM